MELSENPHVDILRFAKIKEAKARYDRYVCTVASGCLADSNDCTSVDGMAQIAMNLMLAADKRWEELEARNIEVAALQPEEDEDETH